MMKNLIKTLGFILAIAGPSVAMATSTQNIIHNKVCISFSDVNKCAVADVPFGNEEYKCESITSSGSIVALDKDGKGNMTFYCEASDGGKHNFKIDCKNGQTGSASNVSSFSYTCKYQSQHSGQTFDVSCIVDDEDQINPACIKEIGVDYGLYGQCGNGKIEAGEECDLWNNPNYNGSSITIGNYLDLDQIYRAGIYKGYSCKNCKIIGGGNFVYEPAECLHTDTPISVSTKEIMPFWWRLWIKESQIVENDSVCYKNVDVDDKGTTNKTTLLKKDSMICHFAVYNGKHKQGEDPVQRFETNCFNENFTKYNIFKYFIGTHQTKADGASRASVKTIINNYKEFGEYKIVLEEVEYKYCNTNEGSRKKGKRYGAICEVNFAVTRPYVMQISTFGVSPVGTTNEDFLHDFYDIQGNQLLNKTDLAKTMNISDSTYANESNLQSEIKKFEDKYKKLAVTVKNDTKINKNTKDVTTLGDIFGKNVTIKKVPNQHIYFIEGGNKSITLEQDKIKKLSSAYTIYIKGMDVKIKGDVLQYAMIITDKKISFQDGGSGGKYSSCASGGQVVQGIFIAGGGFESLDPVRNQKADDYRCPWGGLHVKGVLIGSGITKLMEGKRAQLNGWFNSKILTQSNILSTRRQLIIGGASVLIEYNPSLWKTLPPGAEIFTESLEVYRK